MEVRATQFANIEVVTLVAIGRFTVSNTAQSANTEVPNPFARESVIEESVTHPAKALAPKY